VGVGGGNGGGDPRERQAESVRDARKERAGIAKGAGRGKKGKHYTT